MLLFCLLIIFCAKSEAHENVTIWSFREENQLNENSYAVYSGPDLTTSLMDFTLCFRYKLLFLNDGNSGVNIFRLYYQTHYIIFGQYDFIFQFCKIPKKNL